MTRKLSFVHPASQPESARFRQTVERQVHAAINRWAETPCDVVEITPNGFTRKQQRHNEQQADRLLDELERQLRQFPERESDRPDWRESIRTRIEHFGRTSLGYSAAHCAILFDPEFFQVTRDFVRNARQFDASIDVECLLQALRNVWIMNSIQMFLDLPVSCTSPVFAYSMLYPYTDNYLDDPRVPAGDKQAFNRALGRRLAGEAVHPANGHDRDVFRLVALIEDDYLRSHYPDVYESLLAIHRGQVLSLEQQSRPTTTRDDVLAISLEKGGTSVLAHGYLVQGWLSEPDMSFLFGYGVFLQLMDDMQDVVRDRRNGHETLFSGAVQAPLDQLACRLINFTRRVLDRSASGDAPEFCELANVVELNCLFLIQQAIAVNHHLYSKAFARELECSSPVRFEYLRRRRNVIRAKYDRVRRYLRQRRGVQSVLDVV